MRLQCLHLVCLLTILGITPALAAWELHEETTVKGTVSGTIKKGSVFKMQSGSVYEVTEITILVVVEIMPEALVLKDGDQFKLIIKGFSDPLICKQLVPPTPAKAASQADQKNSQPLEIPSSKDLPLDKLMPPAEQRRAGIQKLTPEEQERLRVFLVNFYLGGVEQGKRGKSAAASPAVSPSSTASTIESEVDGEFEGWEGETIVKLTNGQIWQQSEYHYHYHYAYRPKVLIYRSGTIYKMKVDGADQAVAVTQIK